MILMLQYTAIFSDLLVSKSRCRGDGESLAWHVLPTQGAPPGLWWDRKRLSG